MIETIILGIVQGLTEFLPISSSGHLAVLERMFGISEPVSLAVFLHFGTLIAVVVFFFQPIAGLTRGVLHGNRESIMYCIKIALGTIPIIIAGLLFESWVGQAFTNMMIVSILLGITGTVVLVTGIVQQRQRRVNLLTALLIGIGQMFAILPGISRSGMTISVGLFAGIEPERAFEFSFLLSIPAVLGANVYELTKVSSIGNVPELIMGLIFSFLAGLLALKILRSMVYRHFYLFGPYCLIISIIILLVIR
ncbi:MAG: undecaprenyl-diphosphate phosphatase [candidate division WOR-3 bacterium]|jgi:undecaprenyl-diphosphatase